MKITYVDICRVVPKLRVLVVKNITHGVSYI